jgi:isopenicillin-N epimerase
VPSAAELREEFLLDPEVVFLNHGSFGACPRAVLERYQAWQLELERRPVEFLARRLDGLLAEARARLAAELGADPDDLVFVPNATSGVNVAARALELRAGDEVLSTDLEYGACDLVWDRVCSRAGARYVRAEIPLPLTSGAELVDALFSRLTERTRAVFVSHLTSETALRLPVDEIVRRARSDGLVTVVDGAHAPGHVPVDLGALQADFYSGNCHKWLCAPKGAGFLHVAPERQDAVEATIVSWGSGEDGSFQERFAWQGTRDPSAFLAVPAALDWLAEHEWDAVRERSRALAEVTRTRLLELTGLAPLSPAGAEFLGQMASVPLPPGRCDGLQDRLYARYRIEVPVSARDHRPPLLRVSIQGYNDEADVDALVEALEEELG